ncbi:MAG: FixH family protein [Vicinamibacterales bacterium]|nr:FixH family protein [Vicinamibacterales bacterium]
MKRFSIIMMSFVVSGALAFAHEGNEHVRGVVTKVSPQSITVETTDKKTTTLTVTSKTTFQLARKTAHLADLKIGDRVVVDVPDKSSDALLVQIGTAPAAAQTARAAPAKKLDIAFTSSPKPTRTGDNTFEVTVKDATGKPVTDADVSVLLVMPAMPAMKMPAMRNEVKLKHAGAGKYTGTGQVMTGGMWTVTISVKENGKEVGQKKLSLTAS